MTESFDIIEYKDLREKAKDIVRRMDELERNVVIACSAIFVFSISTFQTDETYSRYLLFLLPVFVSLIGYARYWGLSRYLLEVNTYCAVLEKRLRKGEPGWLSKYYESEGRGDLYFKRFRRHLWHIVLVFNAIIGLWLVIFDKPKLPVG